ncbi:MAG: methyltransferase [Syntrophales bacterium]|nr:methyltransferase [Syntrophales bacterium]
MLKNDRAQAYTLVAIQFLCFFAIWATGTLIAYHELWLFPEMAGMALGAWAFVVMGWHNLHVMPLVAEDAHLVVDGPYGYIRHPMYTAVLLVSWALILDDITLPRLIIGVVLTVDLIIKMLYEESLLKRHFPQYAAYMKTTKRLIPFLI